MDFLPFEIYSSPLDINKYGPIWEIPHYLSDEELKKQTEIIYRHTPINPKTYPNTTIHKSPSEKSIALYEHYRNGNILNYVRDLFPAANYTTINKCIPDFHYTMNIYENTCPVEKVQGNPKGMKMMNSTITKWLRLSIDGDTSDEFLKTLTLQDRTDVFVKMQEYLLVGEKKASK